MTAPAPASVSARHLQLDGSRAYGAGVLHDGRQLETVTAVALEHTRHPHPLAVTAHARRIAGSRQP